MFRGLKRSLGLPLVMAAVFLGLAVLFDTCSSDSDEEPEAPPATRFLTGHHLTSLGSSAPISMP